MKILFLSSTLETTLARELIPGLVENGYEVNKDLFLFPNKSTAIERGIPFSVAAPSSLAIWLKEGFFDVVTVCNIFQWSYWRGVYSFILEHAGDTPVAVVSECFTTPIEKLWTPFPDVNVVAKFYHDKFHEWDGYPLSHTMFESELGKAPKEYDVFFSGHGNHARAPFVKALLESRHENIHVNPTRFGFTYEGYLEGMRKAWISPVLPGAHSYTYRPIETPSQCTCALQYDYRSEVEVRDDFTDNVNAVFFKTPEEMLQKIDELLEDKERCMRIAEAGYEHVMNHHLARHSAKYLMDVIMEKLNA